MTLAERLDNIEATLTVISLRVNEVPDEDYDNDEIGAVIDQLFDALDELRADMTRVENHLTMVEQILDQATRK